MLWISIYLYICACDAPSTARYRHKQLVVTYGSYLYSFTALGVYSREHVTRPQADKHSLQLCTPPARFTASFTMQMSSQQYYSSDTVCARMHSCYILRRSNEPYNRTFTCHTIGANESTAVFSVAPCAVESKAFVLASVLACNVFKP
jgi:hypothetical protein